MLFLPLSLLFENIALALLFFFSIMEARYSLKSILTSTLIPFVFYLMVLGFCSGNFISELNVYNKLIPLLIIPFTLYDIKKEVKLNGIIFLIIGILIIQLKSIYGILDYYYFEQGNKTPLRSYANINSILLYERPYLGYFSALNIILCYFLRQKIFKLFFITSLLFSSLIIIVISARMGFVIMLVTVVAVILVDLNNKVLKYCIITTGTLGLFCLVYFSNVTLKHRFIQIKHDSRMIIWQGGFDVFCSSTKFFFGIKNQAEIEDKLLDYYSNGASFEYYPDKVRFLNKKYNSHNQFLNELMRGGVFGLFLFLFPFCSTLIKNFRKNILMNSLLLLSILLFLLVENLLERQMGVYSVGIILALSNIYSYEKN